MSIDIVRYEKDLSKYFYVKFDVKSSESIFSAAWNIALGQSYGNPTVRSAWETTEMIEAHCAKVIFSTNFYDKEGIVEIGFPLANIDFKTDGISQFLCMIMGGQVDIYSILKCRVVDIELSDEVIKENFLGPKHGMTGLRKKSGQYNKVLMGAILKPKTGASSKILLEMTKALVEGGVDFIKEDEILGNPNVCKLEDRVELISNYISKTNVVYSFCINSDPAYVLDRVRFVENNGGNGVHINFWSGLGVYKSIRELDTNLYIHMQKSGDKILTHKDNPFSISWQVICKLMTWSGADTIHAGMRYGYLHDPLDELNKTLKILRDGNTVPALSCGLTSEIIPDLVEEIGVDFMANAGGSIHGHPKGTTAGALEIRKAIDKIKV